MRSVSRLLGLSVLALALVQVGLSKANASESYPVERGNSGLCETYEDCREQINLQEDPDDVNDDGLTRENPYPNEGAPAGGEFH